MFGLARRSGVPVLMALLGVRGAAAQMARRAPLAVTRREAADTALRFRTTPTFTHADRAEQGPGAVDRTLQTVIGVSTGTVVGGFLGFFASQITTSDWANLPAAERSQTRRRYAVSGAALGAVTGYFVRPRKLHIGTQRALVPVPPRAGRQLLANIDLRRSLGTNAYEAVELDRPEWLTGLDRGARANADTVRTAMNSVAVYLGSELVGGVGTLRDISLAEVTELRFYDADEAERKWGIGHRYGAIEVVSAVYVAPRPVPAAPKVSPSGAPLRP